VFVVDAALKEQRENIGNQNAKGIRNANTRDGKLLDLDGHIHVHSGKSLDVYATAEQTSDEAWQDEGVVVPKAMQRVQPEEDKVDNLEEWH
jgi:hypothetical protein